MNKQQYKRAYHLYRKIQMLEKQMKPTSDNVYEYIWHEIKMLTLEISSLDGWCVMEHFNELHRPDDYQDYWWVWNRFPFHVASIIEDAFKGKRKLAFYRQLVRDYLTENARQKTEAFSLCKLNKEADDGIHR